MTIASEIQRIKTNIANTYDVLENLGATMPATENSDNLASTAQTVSGGDIVTATNTTGSAIAEGDKVWLNKVSGGWNIENFNDYQTHVTKVGSPTITSGVVSDITSSSYVKADVDFNVTPTDSWEIGVCCIKTGNASSSQYFASCGVYTDGPYMSFRNDGQTEIVIWGSTYVDGYYFNFENNQKYWIILSYDGNGHYDCKVSTDGITYTSKGIKNASGITVNKTIQYGYSSSGTYLRGNIYLEDCYIKKNGSKIWYGAGEVIVAPLESLTGFANEAIAVNGTGNVKTILPEQVTVTVTASADNAEITAV